MTNVCSIEACNQRSFARGWCSRHWHRWKIYGDPLSGNTAHGEPNLWLLRAKTYSGDDCIMWPFASNKTKKKNNVGVIWKDGRMQAASRVMCQEIHGDPPAPNYDAAHSCGNGHLGCVTPSHLRWATRKDNSEDSRSHGTMIRGSKSHCAKLTETQVTEILSLRGSMTQMEIAKIYNVRFQTISKIMRRNTWKHVCDPMTPLRCAGEDS